jgi:DNA-binding GntR family transcriptional regulator
LTAPRGASEWRASLAEAGIRVAIGDGGSMGDQGRGFAPVGRLTLQEQVYQALRTLLMVGGVVPGQGLTVRELARGMGTSPMPVREAMRRLIAERALELLPNGTVRVRLMSDSQRAESREIRALLEGLAVARATQEITPEEIAEAERLDVEMNRALAERRLDDYIVLNQRFHFLCYRAARSDILSEVIESLWVQNGPFLRLYASEMLEGRYGPDYADLYQNHADLLAAFRRRDSEAAAAALRNDLGRTSQTRERDQPEEMRLAFEALRRHRGPGSGSMLAPGPLPAGIEATLPPGDARPLPAVAQHRQTLAEQVYRSIRQSLITGDVVPGQVVTVRAFAERLGTSPMPVREALRRLVAERAFEPLPNGSLRVRLMTEEQRQHAREIRALLEGVAVARAADRVSAEELDEARRLNGAMRDAMRRGDIKAASLANQEFHFQIYRAARSEILYEIIEQLWVQNGPFLMLHLIDLMSRPPAARRHGLLDAHDLLLAALARRDAGAAAEALVAELMGTAVTRESRAPELLALLPGEATAPAKGRRPAAGRAAASRPPERRASTRRPSDRPQRT